MIGTCIQRYYPLYGSLVNDGYIVNHQKDGSIVNDLLLNDMAVMIENRQLPWYLHSSLLSLIWFSCERYNQIPTLTLIQKNTKL